MPATGKRTHIPRQLSAQREAELLNAARDLFLSQGVHATTMQQIAQRARVSKTTIYRRFNSKAEMFEALIKSTTAQLVNSIEALEFDENTPKASLRRAAKTIMLATTVPEHINLLRQLIAEVPRNPALKKMVRVGIKTFIPDKLLQFFSSLIRQGLMVHPDPAQAASTFILLCNGGYYPLLDVAGSQAKIQQRLHNDVEMFILGCQIKDPDI